MNAIIEISNRGHIEFRRKYKMRGVFTIAIFGTQIETILV